jgi:GntR family transcriptional regulator
LIEHFRVEGMKPGERVPSEPEIVEQFGVGRSTAREALKLLEHDGLVEVRPGLGRYLTSLTAATVDRPITRFESASEMLRGLGRTPQTLVLSVVEGPPDDEEREALELSDPNAQIVRVIRLRSEADEPLILSEDTLVRAHFPGPIKHIDWNGSINTICRDQGHAPSFSTARIKAVNLPEKYAQRYSLGAYDPWLLITETVYSMAGEPVIFALDYHRSDIFSFNVLRR